ncbi:MULTISPECIES: hypothetical protein [Burkholderia]|uniref:hypothetical protein n=1 Tax=Burkholderia TaxID=32008 RepID=UPI000CFEB27C|nr:MULTISPECIES: hypothetical protein [Burkholderia]MBU9174362.1 hypothetical protein [Burkholderia gladioli]MDD1790448.1 hypothetical protein [Burkholderia gladioli]NBI45263.1 hypothetical protein [Burkholderia sp. ISTR5]PRG91884.1 hypothetical protein C6V08_29350 [Burkholderia gladioli]URV27998.1 hypothetical protein NAL90_33345 [Burkholderia gladioli]
MTSRKNRFLVYLLAALLGVIAVRVVQHIRGEPDGSTPPVTANGRQEDSAEEEDNPFAENVPAHDAYDSFMEKLGDDPKFKLLLAGDKQGSGREKGFGLAQDGLPRLTDAQLEQRLVLMSKVVGGMPDGDCQALSRPTVNTADKQRMLDDAIARFDEADATAWFDFSLASAKAVLDNTPLAQPDRAAVTAALQKIVQQVPQADRQKFLDATSKPATATPADTCWAMRTLYRNAAALGEPDKAAIARGLVVAVN